VADSKNGIGNDAGDLKSFIFSGKGLIRRQYGGIITATILDRTRVFAVSPGRTITDAAGT
jgi:hypothetical protein